MNAQIKDGKYLVTGASGYVGGRLVRNLLNENLSVRVMVRDKAKIKGQPWFNHVEIVEGNANSEPDLIEALTGIHTAYYLLHSASLLGLDQHHLRCCVT